MEAQEMLKRIRKLVRIAAVLATPITMFVACALNQGGDGVGEGASEGSAGSASIPLVAKESFMESAQVNKTACDTRADQTTTVTFEESTWGAWAGCYTHCVSNAFVYSVQVKSESPQAGGDDTALNRVTFHCFNRTSGADAGWIESNSHEDWGTWTSETHSANFVTTNPVKGGVMRIEPSQGSGDDTSVNEVVFNSVDGTQFAPTYNSHWGGWGTTNHNCPSGTAVCGIQNKYESFQSGGDDTSLTGLKFACCTF
jgi:hypothetical protein